MQIRIKTLGYLTLIATLLIVGFIPLAYRLGDVSNTIEFCFIAFLTSSALSFVIMAAKHTHTHITGYMKKSQHIWVFVLIGVFFLVQTIALSYATHYISASLAAVIYRSWPLILILLSPFLLKERVTKWDLAAVLIGFGGMAVTLLAGTPLSIPGFAIPYAALVLFAALIDAFQSGMQKRYQYELSSATFLENFVGLLVITPLALFSAGTFSTPLSIGAISSAVVIGVLQNVALSYFFPMAFRIVRTSIASATLMLAPFVTIVLDYLLLGEPVQYYYLVIAASVFVALIVQRFAPGGSTYVMTSKKEERTPTMYDISSVFSNTKSKAIYDALKGSGRVLAFYKKPESSALASKYTDIVGNYGPGGNCVILTNKVPTDEIRADEYDLIKEILGYDSNDLLVVGIGRPEDVEYNLERIYGEMLQPE